MYSRLLDREYALHFGGDTVRRHIAAVTLPPGGDIEGLTAIRRHTAHKTITIYLQGGFEEFPELRPVATTRCAVTREPDGAGGTFIQINLGSALEPAPVRPRQGKATGQA